MDKQISKHISYKEAVKSIIATKYGIDNTPNESQLKNMIILAEKIFEVVRHHFDVPIAITSFFRSKALNSKIKGSKNSQHLADNGSAIDIDGDIYGGVSNLDIFNFIKDNLIFDQLISEFPDENGNPSWVHVSYKENSNRSQIYVALKDEKGKTIYKRIN